MLSKEPWRLCTIFVQIPLIIWACLYVTFWNTFKHMALPNIPNCDTTYHCHISGLLISIYGFRGIITEVFNFLTNITRHCSLISNANIDWHIRICGGYQTNMHKNAWKNIRKKKKKLILFSFLDNHISYNKQDFENKKGIFIYLFIFIFPKKRGYLISH